MGVSIFNVMADFMHTVDLGIAHYIIGSVLFLLCFYRDYVVGDTPVARWVVDGESATTLVHTRKIIGVLKCGAASRTNTLSEGRPHSCKT